MFDRERKQYAFNLKLIERLMSDVTDDELSVQPLPGMNPPRWILGHIALTSDFALRLLDRESVLPPEWQKAFSPGSKPNDPGSPTPSKAQLLEIVAACHGRLETALAETDEALLAKPHGVRFESLEVMFPTRGELLANMTTGHEALHIGQLSAWRRANGRKPLF